MFRIRIAGIPTAVWEYRLLSPRLTASQDFLQLQMGLWKVKGWIYGWCVYWYPWRAAGWAWANHYFRTECQSARVFNSCYCVTFVERICDPVKSHNLSLVSFVTDIQCSYKFQTVILNRNANWTLFGSVWKPYSRLNVRRFNWLLDHVRPDLPIQRYTAGPVSIFAHVMNNYRPSQRIPKIDSNERMQTMD